MEEIKKSSTTVEDSLWDYAYGRGFEAGYKAGCEDGRRCAMMDAIYGKDEEEQ